MSKATFYLHYKDIYDLSGRLQREVIGEILAEVLHPGLLQGGMTGLTHRLFGAFFARQSLIDILFSGTQAAVLPISIEQGVKEHFCERDPALREDVEFQVVLAYQIHGAYHAYAQNSRRFGAEQVVAILDRITAEIGLIGPEKYFHGA